MMELDLRGLPAPQTGAVLVANYNEAVAGDRFAAVIDEYRPELRIWLLEAGARHSVERSDDAVRLVVERSVSPAQGSIPGVHHVVACGEDVWTCERGECVARITAFGEVAATARVAQKASHLAFDRERHLLIVADAAADRILALDATSLAVRHSWRAPGMPQLPIASPEGIVCVTGSGTGTLTIIRPRAGGYEEQVVEVGRSPHDPLLAPDARHVFVPCAGSAEIVKVRLADGAIVGRCPTGDGPTHLVAHPDGSRIYSANSWDGSLTCLTADGEFVCTVASGPWAHAIDITPDGSTVWVANFFDDTLAIFDAGTLERVAVLPTERYAHGIDASPNGRYVVATGFSSKHLRVFDARTFAQIARVEVGEGSSHTAFAPDGITAYVGCSVSDHVACVDLSHGCARGTVRLHNN